MTDSHPELAAEQAHIDRAYVRLSEARDEALRLKNMVEVGRGGTNQARWEREVINENIVNRLHQLELGERSLCFGRIDQIEEAGAGSYHIGRIAVSSETQEPLIVDWRAPVAEAFYRATGGDPQGLVRRRHFTSRGRTVLGLEDEFFGEAASASRVTVNGREIGDTTPVTLDDVPGGVPLKVRVEIKGMAPQVRSITVKPGRRGRVRVDLVKG